MSWLSALIFCGIPVLGILAAAAYVAAALVRWNQSQTSERHLFILRMHLEARDEIKAIWLAEPNSL